MSNNNLKILTIGNSFTDSLAVYFPQVVESVPGCSLHFERANHGGCELHRHWSYICSEEFDANCRMYQEPRCTLKSILQRENWDVVTIQQASHFSWRAETFQPFADHICDYIRQHAPQAEILIQQTWAYRADDPRLAPAGEWIYTPEFLEKARHYEVDIQPGPYHVTQQQMYDMLTRAYQDLARHQNLRIIPSGYAVQLTRQQDPKPFQPYDPDLLNTLRWPDLPSQSGDVVGRLFWTKDRQSGKLQIGRDSIHLNLRGQYLQACVWFAMLYNRPTADITFIPEEIDKSDAEFLRRAAQQAVNEFPQVG